jgi:hypothetical protein
MSETKKLNLGNNNYIAYVNEPKIRTINGKNYLTYEIINNTNNEPILGQVNHRLNTSGPFNNLSKQLNEKLHRERTTEALNKQFSKNRRNEKIKKLRNSKPNEETIKSTGNVVPRALNNNSQSMSLINMYKNKLINETTPRDTNVIWYSPANDKTKIGKLGNATTGSNGKKKHTILGESKNVKTGMKISGVQSPISNNKLYLSKRSYNNV